MHLLLALRRGGNVERHIPCSASRAREQEHGTGLAKFCGEIALPAGGAINRCSANQILFFQNLSPRFSWTVVSGTTAPNTARTRRTIVHSGKTNFGGTKNVIGLRSEESRVGKQCRTMC